MEMDELKLHSLLVGHKFSHRYYSYLHILKIGHCDQDRIGATHTNTYSFFGSLFANTLTSNKKTYGHFFNAIFNRYLPGITQFYNKQMSGGLYVV
jgi:hypothetical protein